MVWKDTQGFLCEWARTVLHLSPQWDRSWIILQLHLLPLFAFQNRERKGKVEKLYRHYSKGTVHPLSWHLVRFLNRVGQGIAPLSVVWHTASHTPNCAWISAALTQGVVTLPWLHRLFSGVGLTESPVLPTAILDNYWNCLAQCPWKFSAHSTLLCFCKALHTPGKKLIGFPSRSFSSLVPWPRSSDST